jgi:hypothetical protein
MKEKEFFDAIGRALYWNFTKRTTETPPRWAALKEDERALWRSMARTAHRKIQELATQPKPPASA